MYLPGYLCSRYRLFPTPTGLLKSPILARICNNRMPLYLQAISLSAFQHAPALRPPLVSTPPLAACQQFGVVLLSSFPPPLPHCRLFFRHSHLLSCHSREGGNPGSKRSASTTTTDLLNNVKRRPHKAPAMVHNSEGQLV